MQQLKYYCFLGFFEGTYQGFSNWVRDKIAGSVFTLCPPVWT